MINERTKRLREKMEKRKATICAQRAVLYTQSFQQTEGEPYILREGHSSSNVVAQIKSPIRYQAMN